MAFAQAPPQQQWTWIEDRQQLAAWSNFLAEHIASARPPLIIDRTVDGVKRSGFFAPWPWPPRKDGKTDAPGGTGETA